jgi:hypothetical protein
MVYPSNLLSVECGIRWQAPHWWPADLSAVHTIRCIIRVGSAGNKSNRMTGLGTTTSRFLANGAGAPTAEIPAFSRERQTSAVGSQISPCSFPQLLSVRFPCFRSRLACRRRRRWWPARSSGRTTFVQPSEITEPMPTTEGMLLVWLAAGTRIVRLILPRRVQRQASSAAVFVHRRCRRRLQRHGNGGAVFREVDPPLPLHCVRIASDLMSRLPRIPRPALPVGFSSDGVAPALK